MSDLRVYEPFDDALLFGQSAQDRVADALRLHGAKCDKKDSRERYDFEAVFNNHVFRVEVKNEDRYADSGNICIETGQGKPRRKSGIAYSEATLFVHTLGDYVVAYRTREMLEFLRTANRTGQRTERMFGDNNNVGFVIPIADLLGFNWFHWGPMSVLHQSRLWTF